MKSLKQSIGKLMITILFGTLILCSAPRALAQAGADPGFSLDFIQCQEGVFGTPFSFAVGRSVPPNPSVCSDTTGPSTFGEAFANIQGICDSNLLTDNVEMDVTWAFCTTPLVGESVGGFGTHIVTSVGVCGSTFNVAGQVFGRARAFDFFLGKIIAEGQEGFADCVDNSSPSIPPAISHC